MTTHAYPEIPAEESPRFQVEVVQPPLRHRKEALIAMGTILTVAALTGTKVAAKTYENYTKDGSHKTPAGQVQPKPESLSKP